MKPLQTLFITLATAGAVLGASARLASANEHVLVVLDVTGSMDTPSIPGMTRLDVAKARLTAFLSTVPSVTSEYSLWFFEGSTYTPIYTFADHRTRADLTTAISGARTGGATPLAHTICAAVDELVNYLPSELHTKRIELATDGEENNTPAIDQCFGPSSSTAYPTLDVGSWQWKVRNKACTGNATTPGVCGGGVPPGGLTLIVDVAHLFDFVPPFAARATVTPETGRHTRDAFTAIAAPPANADAAFFSGLAQETHGRYTGITPATPPALAAPIAGDANADGCVNIQDRALVLQQYGTPGNGTDFNHDGIVNTFDLQTVLQNFGRGCIP
jgi:hypothetical protein